MNLELLKLLEIKEKSVLTEEDIKKVKLLKELLKKQDFFFNISYSAAINILLFLGISSADVNNKYLELTSIEKYNELLLNERKIFKQ